MSRVPALLAVPLLVLFCLAPDARSDAGKAAPHPSQFALGDGVRQADGVWHLLDAARTKGQSNAVAFDLEHEGAHERMALRCTLNVLDGGDGGAFLFLNTREYGVRGPAPFLPRWTAPNLSASFAVGIDLHDPHDPTPFGPSGNYRNEPQREVSLHFDGRELVKRVTPHEFRGADAAVSIDVDFVVGGAEVTVQVGEGKVYDRYFIAHLLPYEARVAIGASTLEDAAAEFRVRDVMFEVGEPAAPRRPPLHVGVFNHVLTDNAKTAYEVEVDLPPLEWAFGRVILTLEIHDAGKDWDEWDRNGEVSIFDADGVKRGIVPFITSYRTPCHWKVDVTHFRPYLTGKTRFEVRAGTTFYKNRGYMMSVALDFHHGATPLVPCEVVSLWHGTAKYGSPENHFQDFFEPRQVTIPEGIEGARVFTTTTGHSQVGEFTPSHRVIVMADDEQEVRYGNRLWKDDCYLNPNRPQFGTWKFSRAGWAPGDVVWPWWIDLTEDLKPGGFELRYETSPYDFDGAPQVPTEKQVGAASHVVRSYLILYRRPTAVIAAPTLLVTNVADGSNAAKAGMRRGDYLASYDGRTIDSVDDLRAAIQGAVAAEKTRVAVVVFRGLERVALELDAGTMGINLGSR